MQREGLTPRLLQDLQVLRGFCVRSLFLTLQPGREQLRLLLSVLRLKALCRLSHLHLRACQLTPQLFDEVAGALRELQDLESLGLEAAQR